jgi:SAM-dependent methyltransferase
MTSAFREQDTMKFTEFAGSKKNLARLEERNKRIILANKSNFIEGKRVLDLAANNGRWSVAAAHAGAKEVLAVEGREELVAEATDLAKEHGVRDRCRFMKGDIYDWLYAHRSERVDTVFCLGVYYHIMDHYHLLRSIARLKPSCILIDSGFVRSFKSLVHVQTENPNLELNALPAFEGQAGEIVGFVSLGLMNQMAWNCGYVVDPIIWDPAEVEHKRSVHDYLLGRRFTLRLTPQENLGGYDQRWQERWREALVRLNPKFEKLLDPQTAHLAEDGRVLESARATISQLRQERQKITGVADENLKAYRTVDAALSEARADIDRLIAVADANKRRYELITHRLRWFPLSLLIPKTDETQP